MDLPSHQSVGLRKGLIGLRKILNGGGMRRQGPGDPATQTNGMDQWGENEVSGERGWRWQGRTAAVEAVNKVIRGMLKSAAKE